jgi:hypothetical protein
MVGFCEHGDEPSGSKEAKNFFVQLKMYPFMKKNPISCSQLHSVKDHCAMAVRQSVVHLTDGNFTPIMNVK